MSRRQPWNVTASAMPRRAHSSFKQDPFLPVPHEGEPRRRSDLPHLGRRVQEGGHVLDGHEPAHHADERRVVGRCPFASKAAARQSTREALELEAEGHHAEARAVGHPRSTRSCLTPAETAMSASVTCPRSCSSGGTPRSSRARNSRAGHGRGTCAPPPERRRGRPRRRPSRPGLGRVGVHDLRPVGPHQAVELHAATAGRGEAGSPGRGRPGPHRQRPSPRPGPAGCPRAPPPFQRPSASCSPLR